MSESNKLDTFLPPNAVCLCCLLPDLDYIYTSVEGAKSRRALSQECVLKLGGFMFKLWNTPV